MLEIDVCETPCCRIIRIQVVFLDCRQLNSMGEYQHLPPTLQHLLHYSTYSLSSFCCPCPQLHRKKQFTAKKPESHPAAFCGFTFIKWALRFKQIPQVSIRFIVPAWKTENDDSPCIKALTEHGFDETTHVTGVEPISWWCAVQPPPDKSRWILQFPAAEKHCVWFVWLYLNMSGYKTLQFTKPLLQKSRQLHIALQSDGQIFLTCISPKAKWKHICDWQVTEIALGMCLTVHSSLRAFSVTLSK